MEIYGNEIKYIENFIDEETSKTMFFNLLKEIPWMTFIWTHNEVSCSYMYGSFERDLSQKESLEDLITLVETTFETDVLQLRCKLYKNGKDGMSTKRSDVTNGVVHLLLGTSRKLVCTDCNGKSTVFTMKNCSMVYVPSGENSQNTFFSVKKNKRIRSPSIHIYFYINNPYKYRIYNKCTVHLLGYGNMVVDYDKKTYPEGLKDKTIIAISYSDRDVSTENNNGIYLAGTDRQFRLFEG